MLWPEQLSDVCAHAQGGVIIPTFGPGMAPAAAPMLTPAPGPYMPLFVPAPAPMDGPSMAPAPGPYIPPLVPGPAPTDGPSLVPAPGPYMPPLVPVPAPVDGPSMAPAPADSFAPAPWTYSPMMALWLSEPWGELSAINALDGFCHCSRVLQHASFVCVCRAGLRL